MDNWKRVFAIIWTGQFLSILTSSIVNFAIVLWLSLETGSAEVLAFATMAALLPQSVLGLFTGIFIDRWKRKRVMIMADSFIAFCTLILAVLFYFDMKMTNILLLDVAGAAFTCLSLCFVFIPDSSHEERNSELHFWREAKEAILYFATFTTVIQSRIDPGVMGRVFSFYMSFSMLPSMIGLLSTGFLADSIGLGNTFIISGGFLCLIGIISFFIPSLISLKESFKR